jgi:hypothetical protein
LLVVVLLAGGAWGAADRETCQGDLKLLRSAEAEQCSGMSYIFNPSACFNTRKAISSLNSERCGQPAVTAVPASSPVDQPAPAKPGPAVKESPTAASEPASQQPPPRQVVAVPLTETEQIKAELAELKAELLKLKGELAEIRSRQR